MIALCAVMVAGCSFSDPLYPHVVTERNDMPGRYLVEVELDGSGGQPTRMEMARIATTLSRPGKKSVIWFYMRGQTNEIAHALVEVGPGGDIDPRFLGHEDPSRSANAEQAADAAMPARKATPEDVWAAAAAAVSLKLAPSGTVSFGDQSPADCVAELGNGRYSVRGWVEVTADGGERRRRSFQATMIENRGAWRTSTLALMDR